MNEPSKKLFLKKFQVCLKERFPTRTSLEKYVLYTSKELAAGSDRNGEGVRESVSYANFQ